MPDALMYDEEMFVVLETDQPEVFLTPEELSIKLKGLLKSLQNNLPMDLEAISTIDAQVQYLMDTSCELDLGPDQFLQWYVVRMDK
jgi:hypothetical protein